MNLTNQFNVMWKACLVALFSISLLIAAPAHNASAQGNVATPGAGAKVTGAENTQIANILCNVVNLISGNIGKAIAVLIIITLAIALFLGKVSWGMAIAVAVGMGILFGAPNLVALISGGGADTVCPK